MPTFTALTTLTGREPAEALGEAMERMEPAPTGVGVFEVEDGSGLWEVGGYFTDTPDPAALALLAVAFEARPFAVSELPETDWVAQVRRELTPVVAGRFFVHGSHDAEKLPQGSVGLLIDAAMAFGTGHHGTTLGCLNALERLVSAGVMPRSVLDVGCGTAVLAMAAAKIWDVPVIASDIDPVAVETAAANVTANGLSERVEVIEATGTDHASIAAASPFDLIFANILMGPLIELAPDLARVAAPGANLILSGILTGQAEAVAEVYADVGYNLVKRVDIVDWTTLNLRLSDI